MLSRILKLRKNITIIIAQAFVPQLRGDYIFTMGEYWDSYYIEKLGYKKEQIRLIGDHDLDGFESNGEHEKAICYIANVLVEDGTVRRKDFDEFLQALAEAIDPKAKLYVKLHPRSDKNLYKPLDRHNVEYIRTGKLPSVNLYIGHRSALLGRALYESDNLIIWRFANEEVCFYERFATATCMDRQSLIHALQNVDITACTNKKLDEIRKVYWNNPKGSMRTAAELIYEYSTNNEIERVVV